MRVKVKHSRAFSLCVIILFVFVFFGVFDHINEINFKDNFEYPLNKPLSGLINQVLNNLKTDFEPINEYPYSFLISCENKCMGTKPFLVILIKSSLNHFVNRNAIRKTWGAETSETNKSIKTVFFLGINKDDELQNKINEESNQYKDIVQIDFIDAYLNNTIKTMMAFKWAYLYCNKADYFLFSDDDMFVSIKNVYRFISNPVSYPTNAETEAGNDEQNVLQKTEVVNGINNNLQKIEVEYYGLHNIPHKTDVTGNENIYRPKESNRNSNYHQKTEDENVQSNHPQKTEVIDDKDVKFMYAGFVFKTAPHRHYLSKWQVSLKEYPYDMWPTYVTAGAYLVNHVTMKHIYAGSLFVKHFKFDDIYLGIVAKKIGIEPFHCKEFYFYKKPYSRLGYVDVIASHGFHNPDELVRVWNEQKSLGHA